MTQFIITDVVDEIDEWKSQYGDFMYSVVAFAGKEMIKITKKDRDKAEQVQGQLRESIGIPRELVVEDAGLSKAGNQKWKLLALAPISLNGNGNGHAPSLPEGRAIALQAAAVWSAGNEWEIFEMAFQRMYALLGGIDATEVSSNRNGDSPP
jgi:hypothetical protein